MIRAGAVVLTELRTQDSAALRRWINDARTTRFNAPWRPVAPSAHEADDRNDVIAERIAFDEGFADAVLDLVVGPAHCDAGADNRAHRSAANNVERQACFAQSADNTDMGVSAGAAAGEH